MQAYKNPWWLLLKQIFKLKIVLPGSKVNLDVDEDHDAGWDVEGPEGRVHHISHILANLIKIYILLSLELTY